jgi:hypothetical protein
MISIHMYLFSVKTKYMTACIPNCTNFNRHATYYSTHYVLWLHVIIPLIKLLEKYVTRGHWFTVTINHNAFLFWFTFFCILCMCNYFLLSKHTTLLMNHAHKRRTYMAVCVYLATCIPSTEILDQCFSNYRSLWTGRWVLNILSKSLSFYFAQTFIHTNLPIFYLSLSHLPTQRTPKVEKDIHNRRIILLCAESTVSFMIANN